LETNKIYCGNCIDILKSFPNKSVNCCITSPPYYGLRDYGVSGQIGNEDTLEQYIENLVNVFEQVKRILKDDGVLWLNLGDSWLGTGGEGRYKRNQNMKASGIKCKDLIGIPWMAAFALREAGWYLRQDIIWAKGNPMPESVKDRCTKSHEYIFLLSKSRKYYFDYESIKEPAKYPNDNRGSRNDSRRGTKMNSISGVTGEKRNKRDVWNVNTKPCREAHFATFPDTLIEPCVLAGCPEGGIILDPFMGAGTTGMVAKRHNRNYVGIELNPDYVQIAENRIEKKS
jgi:DNA modification methylase